MKAITKIIFVDDHGEKFFGEGPARLLRGVEETGSLRAAAMSMDMAAERRDPWASTPRKRRAGPSPKNFSPFSSQKVILVTTFIGYPH